MPVAFHRVLWDGYSPFHIGFDPDSPDAYTDWVRNHDRPEPGLQYVLEAVRGKKTLIDLGANIGYYSLSAVNAGARVLAVEALPKNYSLLVQSAAANRFTGLTPVHAAIFETTGTLCVGGVSAWGQISTAGVGHEVPSITLDDLAQVYGFMDADILKMDVEGAELAALKGGAALLSRTPSPRIVFEANAYAGLQFGYRIGTLLRQFELLGYRLYMFFNNVLVPKGADEFQETVYADYLAVADQHLAALPGFEVRKLTINEQSQIIQREASVMPAPHRAYIHVLSDSIPNAVRQTPTVEAALETLRADSSPEFRSAVAALRTFYP